MILPTIHINGTSQSELARVNQAALRSVNAAIEAMAEASPNGRDYYPQGSDAMNGAQREHIARVAALTQIKRDLETVVEHIDKGGLP